MKVLDRMFTGPQPLSVMIFRRCLIPLVLVLSLLPLTSCTPLFQPISIPSPSHLPSLRSSSSYPAFNDTLSQLLLLYSSAAYSSSPFTCLSSHLPSPPIVTHTFSSSIFSTSLFGFASVSSSPPSLLFTFQGSMTYKQLYEELMHDTGIPPSNASSLLVNQYFWEGAQALLPSVSSAYANLTSLYPSYPVYFTGHSLGGAFATLLAYLLTSSPSPPTSPPLLYTFGEPRIGNLAFSLILSHFLPSHHRVVHWRDIVPHLPPCPTILDPVTHHTVCGGVNETHYAYHSKVEVWYSSAMPQWGEQGDKGVTWIQCEGSPEGEDQKCSDGLDWYWLDDHYYYYNLEVGDFCLTMEETMVGRLGRGKRGRQQYERGGVAMS